MTGIDPMKSVGRLIIVEGINACGKTSFVKELQDIFDRNGITNKEMSMMPESSLRQEILTQPSYTPQQRLLMIRTLSLSVQREIKQELAAGKWVILDRGWISYEVYQGVGDELKPLLNGLERLLCDPFIKPDFLIYLDVEVDVALTRRMQRKTTDHFEERDIEYEQKILDAFRMHASDIKFVKHPSGFIFLDGCLPAMILAEIAYDSISGIVTEEFKNYLEQQ